MCLDRFHNRVNCRKQNSPNKYQILREGTFHIRGEILFVGDQNNKRIMSFTRAAVIFGLFCLVGWVKGQVGTTGIFPSGNFSNLIITPKVQYILPPIDNTRILAHELIEQKRGMLKPYRFGQSIPFSLSIKHDGEWSLHPSKSARVWHALIQSPGATSMSVFFDEFTLPQDSELYLIGRSVSLGVIGLGYF